MARSRTATLTVGLVLTLTACTGGEPPAGDETASTTDPPVADTEEEIVETDGLEVVWATDLEVFSGPIRVDDDTVLVHVTEGDRVYLVGIDVGSGEERWRQETSPGEVVTGISLSPDAVAGHPVYFRPHPAGNLFAQLVVADPTTGEDVTVSEPLLFGSYPSACDDDPESVCLRARDTYEDAYRWRRLELDGAGELQDDDGRPEATRALAERGLLDVRVDGTEHLAVVADGEELWRREVSEVIGPGFSSDGGWGWSYDEPTDRYIGSLGVDAAYDPGGVNTRDLSAGRVVAIERATGETVWAEDGVDHLCGSTLHVPTDAEVASAAAGEDRVPRLPVPVRCRTEGTVSFDGGDPDAEPVREGIAVELEGFDPETGETTWRVTPDDPGQVLGRLLGEDLPVMRAGTTGVVLRVDGEDVVLDLLTGRTRPVEDDERFWCAGDDPTFDYREPYHFEGGPQTERYGQEPHGWCDASGGALDESATPPTTVPNGVGAPVGEVTVVATPDGLRAYRQVTSG